MLKKKKKVASVFCIVTLLLSIVGKTPRIDNFLILSKLHVFQYSSCQGKYHILLLETPVQIYLYN